LFKADAKTRLYFLIGNPVAHSVSPAIHNAAFTALNINSVYTACRVAEPGFAAAMDGIRALSVAGANVTAPYKEAVIAYLDSISPEALMIRSVNTIINQDGELHGESTDGEGFYCSLRELISDYKDDQNIMIFGAGGAARAVAYAMANHDTDRFAVINRNPEKGNFLADLLSKKPNVKYSRYLPLDRGTIKKAIKDYSVIIYGLSIDEPKFMAAISADKSSCKGKLLIDLRYHPSKTAVMTMFEDSGGKAYNGLGMLIRQAALSFELFTGQQAPLAVMREAAANYYNCRGGRL